MANAANGLLNLLQTLSQELQDVSPQESGHAYATIEQRRFAVERFRERCRKRAKLGDSELRDIALQNFEEWNERLCDVNLTLDRDIEHIAKQYIAWAFETYNARCDPELIQVAYDYRHLHDLWRFGPGTSNGVRGTHTVDKIGQPMTVTSACELAVQNLRNDNVYLGLHDLQRGDYGTTRVAGSKMTTVAKNELTDRTISIEPSGNMACQLALGGYITGVLRLIGLDIRTQQAKNKGLAKEGSVHRNLATLDLKNASDGILIELCRRLFPDGVFKSMMLFRSPVTTLPDGRQVKLNMMSTMGNGFTFPMMTMLLVALVYANTVKLGKARRPNWVDWSSHGVYGDDIIVPTCEVPGLLEVLASAGFVVNHDKSYYEGPFRESCGGDYYDGWDVTPVYVKSLYTDADRYVAINRIFEWCARQQILLPRTLTLLFNGLKDEVLFVPEWLGDDAGFRTVEVPRRFTYLEADAKSYLYGGPFSMMLAVGGYLTPLSLKEFNHFLRKRGREGCPAGRYTPRPFKTGYRRLIDRLPSGFLTGRDCFSRSDEISSYVESYAFLGRL